MTEFADLPPDDQQAIGNTLLTLLTGFRDRDAEALLAVYSDDADWVNAFGTVKRGRADIVDYLQDLFADSNFARGEPDGPPETSFRVLTPEVVLVSAHLRIKGQGLVGGGTLDRDNFSLRALQRQPDGSWLVVSEMFQDANSESTYAR
ncbi:MAG: SgcJ/EcaC family oxidoreductase [Mycobacterium sp.]|nr:SgcJ/EcaC family oxidoreductase [Mycobacterium sp.]MBV9721528.1 SgcJ/EcaC family oxidoreductase [Mycobacterium sp.]